MTPDALTLPELVDVEARLAADASGDPSALRTRDHGIYGALTEPPTGRARLLVAWLRGLGDERPRLGETVARAHRVLGAALVVGGLGFGWGTAGWVLAYDGSRPVNVAAVMAVLVLGQLALLAVLGVSVTVLRVWPTLADRAPLLGDLRDLLRWAAAAVTERLAGVGGEARAEREAAWRRLRSRRSLYRPVERWTLFGLAQSFGVAFNVGALACFVQLVVFSDLAFGWSTTLSLEAETFGGFARALAAPWGWVWSAGVPGAELVEQTRYSRLEAAYAGAQGGRALDPALVGGWWPFLFAAVGVYGLLPRLALLVLARRMVVRTLRRLPLDTPEVDAVLRRLRSARVETRAASPEPGRALSTASAEAIELEAAERCAVVVWRDVPLSRDRAAEMARARFGGDLAALLPVGDYAAEAAALEQLGPDPVIVVAEAWEAPDKAVRRFLSRVRGAVGPDGPVVVGLVGETPEATPAAEQLTVWRRNLARLEDPYLSVETLEAP